MKKIVSSIITVAIIVAITVALIVGGLVLLHIGNTPLYVQFLHLVGLILFLVGLVLAIVMLFIAYISIHDYFNPSNQEQEGNRLRSD